MTPLRSALATTALLVPLLVLAGPAHAAGRTCAETSQAIRCAEVTGRNASVTGTVVVRAARERARVRVARVVLRRETAQGWVVVAEREGSSGWRQGSHTVRTSIACDDAPGGRYRVAGVVESKLGAQGTVFTRRILSSPVRKAAVCG